VTTNTGGHGHLLNASLRFKSTGKPHMASNELPQDFREFLKLLADHKVDYLLIGGYAVGYYGYPRTTADMDIWVSLDSENAEKLVRAFNEFGMVSDEVTPALFRKPGNIVRMGVPPVRIEVLNEIDGVDFVACSERATIAVLDGVPARLISLGDLRANKRASGRHKDLDDLEHLPDGQ
jgi:predicted nucleotidyltransferase